MAIAISRRPCSGSQDDVRWSRMWRMWWIWWMWRYSKCERQIIL